MSHDFVVELVEEEGGPEPELRDRFAVIITRRLQKLEEQSGAYPCVGEPLDFLDTFTGTYVWEMTDAELEATPPTQVDVEVLAVEPVEPSGSGTVTVRARIPF